MKKLCINTGSLDAGGHQAETQLEKEAVEHTQDLIRQAEECGLCPRGPGEGLAAIK